MDVTTVPDYLEVVKNPIGECGYYCPLPTRTPILRILGVLISRVSRRTSAVCVQDMECATCASCVHFPHVNPSFLISNGSV